VVFARFRVFSSANLGGSWLASSPFVLGLPRTLGSSVRERREELLRSSQFSSPALRRHLSVFPLPRPPSYPRPTSTVIRARKAPRVSFSALQHFRTRKPFFALSFWKSVQGILPHPLKVPPPGFGYPLDGAKLPNPGGPLSAPNAPGLHPSELSSSIVVPGKFPSPASAPALPCITSAALHRRFSVSPTMKAVSLLAARRVSPGRNLLLSWAFRPPRLPPHMADPGIFSLPRFPSRSYLLPTSQ